MTEKRPRRRKARRMVPEGMIWRHRDKSICYRTPMRIVEIPMDTAYPPFEHCCDGRGGEWVLFREVLPKKVKRGK